MSDVSCRVFNFFETAAEVHGFDLEELVAGLDMPLPELQDPSRRAPWPLWAELCHRLEARIGAEQIWALSLQINEMSFARSFRQLTSTIISIERLYTAVCSWLGPFLFRHASYELKVHSRDRVTVDIRIPEHLTGCVPWLRMNEAALASVPHLLGAPTAQVRSRVTPWHGHFEIYAPTDVGPMERLRRRLRITTQPQTVLDELTEMQQDLREAYEGLAESERELRQVLECLPDPVALVTRGKLVFANRAWQAAFGMSLDALAPELFEAARPRTDVRLSISEGESRTYVTPPAVPVRYQGENSLMVMFRDVTAERAEADQAALTDRLTMLGTLAACVGHEINNPLAYVTSSLELMQTELENAQPNRIALHEGLLTALEGLRKVATISQDLNTLAKHRRELTAVPIDEVVDLALRIAGNEVRHVADVQRDRAHGWAHVRADSGRLGQVFVNLIINAAHAMAADGQDGHRLRIATQVDGDEVLVEVEDDGIGMSEDLQDRAFQPFFTTKEERGTGLGLAVCRKIVDEHGGAIELWSRVGEGTRFTVRLPRVEAEARSESQPPQVRREFRVLVVDDEPLIPRLIQRLLAAHRVEVRFDSEAVLVELEKDRDFDVILCDVMMPGLSGIEFHQRLAQQDPALARRVVFLTGGTFTEESQAYLAQVPNARLFKPFRRNDLLSVLARVPEREDGASSREPSASQTSRTEPGSSESALSPRG